MVLYNYGSKTYFRECLDALDVSGCRCVITDGASGWWERTHTSAYLHMHAHPSLLDGTHKVPNETY